MNYILCARYEAPEESINHAFFECPPVFKESLFFIGVYTIDSVIKSGEFLLGVI